MAKNKKKKKISVDSYVRKDGTRVSASTRTLSIEDKRKRPQKLSKHLTKGLKRGAAVGSGYGALSGFLVGNIIGGPPAGVALGTAAALDGAISGSILGGVAGPAIYGVKRHMAKKRDPEKFKEYFDYSRHNPKSFIGFHG